MRMMGFNVDHFETLDPERKKTRRKPSIVHRWRHDPPHHGPSASQSHNVAAEKTAECSLYASVNCKPLRCLYLLFFRILGTGGRTDQPTGRALEQSEFNNRRHFGCVWGEHSYFFPVFRDTISCRQKVALQQDMYICNCRQIECV